MPALTESTPLEPWQLLFWGVVLVCAVAAMVFAVRSDMERGESDRSDPVFWDIFGGVAVAFPAVLIPALASPLAGLALTVIGCATAVTAYVGSPRVMAWQELRRRRRVAIPGFSAAEARHEQLLARWQHYEIDPALTIDYPDMADVRRPETAAFVRAMRQADRLRTLAESGYVPSVARLELALAAAERAAGVPLLNSAADPAGQHLPTEELRPDPAHF